MVRPGSDLLSACQAENARFLRVCDGYRFLRGRPSLLPRHATPGRNGIRFASWFGWHRRRPRSLPRPPEYPLPRDLVFSAGTLREAAGFFSVLTMKSHQLFRAGFDLKCAHVHSFHKLSRVLEFIKSLAAVHTVHILSATWRKQRAYKNSPKSGRFSQKDSPVRRVQNCRRECVLKYLLSFRSRFLRRRRGRVGGHRSV
jgi:hypothetical protein